LFVYFAFVAFLHAGEDDRYRKLDGGINIRL